METRRIGDLEVSIAGLGTNNFGRRLDASRSREVVAAALDAGVTFFDTADTYGEGRSEEYLGRALGRRRDEVVIATKFGFVRPSEAGRQADWAPAALDASLRRLGTDHVDLYYYHKPDPQTPLADTLELMNGFVAQGKVREIGCSNFSAAQLDEAARIARERGWRPFAVVQNEFNLLQRAPQRAGVLDACDRLGMAFVPYYPLAAGLLTGKYRRGRPLPGDTRLASQSGARPAEQFVDADKLEVVERLAGYAAAHDHTLLELALAWLASQPRVASVIAGAMSAEQVRADVAAVAAWRLTVAAQGEVGRLAA